MQIAQMPGHFDLSSPSGPGHYSPVPLWPSERLVVLIHAAAATVGERYIHRCLTAPMFFAQEAELIHQRMSTWSLE